MLLLSRLYPLGFFLPNPNHKADRFSLQEVLYVMSIIARLPMSPLSSPLERLIIEHHLGSPNGLPLMWQSAKWTNWVLNRFTVTTVTFIHSCQKTSQMQDDARVALSSSARDRTLSVLLHFENWSFYNFCSAGVRRAERLTFRPFQTFTWFPVSQPFSRSAAKCVVTRSEAVWLAVRPESWFLLGPLRSVDDCF